VDAPPVRHPGARVPVPVSWQASKKKGEEPVYSVHSHYLRFVCLRLHVIAPHYLVGLECI
jgi:hypothetical protein